MPIEDVGDVVKCIVVLSRRSTGTDRTQYNKAFVTGELTSTTNLRLKREGTGTNVIVEWGIQPKLRRMVRSRRFRLDIFSHENFSEEFRNNK